MFFHYFTFGKEVEKRILVMLSKFLSVDLKSSWGDFGFEICCEEGFAENGRSISKKNVIFPEK